MKNSKITHLTINNSEVPVFMPSLNEGKMNIIHDSVLKKLVFSLPCTDFYNTSNRFIENIQNLQEHDGINQEEKINVLIELMEEELLWQKSIKDILEYHRIEDLMQCPDDSISAAAVTSYAMQG